MCKEARRLRGRDPIAGLPLRRLWCWQRSKATRSGRVSRTIPCPSHAEHGIEAAVDSMGRIHVWRNKTAVGGPGSQNPPREDLATGAGGLFFRRGAHQGGLGKRKAMIDRSYPLPVIGQCQLLGLARSTAYYHPMPLVQPVLVLIRRINELRLQDPVAGARMLRDPRSSGGGIWPYRHAPYHEKDNMLCSVIPLRWPSQRGGSPHLVASAVQYRYRS